MTTVNWSGLYDDAWLQCSTEDVGKKLRIEDESVPAVRITKPKAHEFQVSPLSTKCCRELLRLEVLLYRTVTRLSGLYFKRTNCFSHVFGPLN